jgi:glycosyltransferase involved in cell wall biosynthesis
MVERINSNKKLRVLVSVPSGLDGQGGIDRIMAAFGHELQRQKRADVDVQFHTTRGNRHVAFSAFHVLGFCMRMLAGRMTGRLDLVHLNLSSFGSTYRKLIIAAWARAIGLPYVLHLHGSQYQAFWKDDQRLLTRRIRAMFEHAGCVVALGQTWRDFIALRAPLAAGKIVIVPNATAIPVLPHAGGGESTHILFLGRVGERKGVPQLIEALHAMRDHPGWRATIAGDGDVEAARSRVKALGLADRIRLPGWVGPSDVAALIASADILVLPSFAENLPVSVIEGMASGLAVVATPVGAVEDIIADGQTGLLVPPGDVPALTEALTRLIDDPVLRNRLGAAALAVHRERLELAPFTDALCSVWKAAARR